MASNGNEIQISIEPEKQDAHSVANKRNGNGENAEPKIRDDEWVKQLRESLKSTGVAPSIFRVPKTLLNENEKAYVPQIMCLGPYHFMKTGANHNEMEALKSEVARKVHQKKGDFEAIVKEIQQKETTISDYYGKEVKCSRQALGWMMVRDVCLILEVLNNLADEAYSEVHNKDWPVIDAILNRKRHNPLLNDIVKDMLKMENQIPLFLLQEIFMMLRRDDTPEKARDDFKLLLRQSCEYLTPFPGEEPPPPDSQRLFDSIDLKSQKHILELLHTYIVGKDFSKQENTPSGTAVSNTSTRGDSPTTEEMPGTQKNDWVGKVFDVFFFLCLCFVGLLFVVPVVFYVLWLIFNEWLYWRSSNKRNVSCVAELRHVGVKFTKCDGGIREIKFDQENRTLYLPQFKVDDRSEVIIRNLMALEICSESKEKPITRYVLLMNELIDTEVDVGILRNNSIITNYLGSDTEAAKLWNSIKKPTEIPPYSPINEASGNMKDYCKKTLRVLWAQFQEIHCSKPWVAVSVVAGTALLFLTVVQVVCLFRTCTLK